MNTRSNAARRLKGEVTNAGSFPHDEQVPPVEENSNVDQAPANPPRMAEAEMRDILDQMAKAMTTHTQAATVHAQDMTFQSNRDVAPRPHQQVTTTASNQVTSLE